MSVDLTMESIALPGWAGWYRPHSWHCEKVFIEAFSLHAPECLKVDPAMRHSPDRDLMRCPWVFKSPFPDLNLEQVLNLVGDKMREFHDRPLTDPWHDNRDVRAALLAVFGMSPAERCGRIAAGGLK